MRSLHRERRMLLSRAKEYVTNGSPQDPWKRHSETETRLHRWSVKPATSAWSWVDKMRWDKKRMPVRSCRWKHTSRWRSKREMKTGVFARMSDLKKEANPWKFCVTWRILPGKNENSTEWSGSTDAKITWEEEDGKVFTDAVRGRIEITGSAMCLNCCFQKGRTRSASDFQDSVIQIMVMTEHHSGAKLTSNVKTKDNGDEKICKTILKWLQELDYDRLVMKYDDERSAYWTLWRQCRRGELFVTRTQSWWDRSK